MTSARTVAAVIATPRTVLRGAKTNVTDERAVGMSVSSRVCRPCSKTQKSLWVVAYRLQKKATNVIPSKARDLLFAQTPRKKQIPRANFAPRNDTCARSFRKIVTFRAPSHGNLARLLTLTMLSQPPAVF